LYYVRSRRCINQRRRRAREGEAHAKANLARRAREGEPRAKADLARRRTSREGEPHARLRDQAAARAR